MAEGLGTGLQNLLHRFKSGWHLLRIAASVHPRSGDSASGPFLESACSLFLPAGPSHCLLRRAAGTRRPLGPEMTFFASEALLFAFPLARPPVGAPTLTDDSPPVPHTVIRSSHIIAPAAMRCMGMIMCMARSGQERSRLGRR